MKKQIIRDIKLIIHLGWGTDELKLENANEIIKHIKTNKDLPFFDINIEKDIIDICEFCGNEWGVDENGKPLCCDKAREEFANNKAVLIDEPKGVEE